MSIIKQRRVTTSMPDSGATTAAGLVGKRTLTEGIRLRQAKANGAVGADGEAESPAGGGAALPGDVLGKMERSFGTSFAEVRVHEGPQAAAVGAQAYAEGSDVHFAPGKYEPHSAGGQALLGHELAHVVQQRAGRVEVPQGKDVDAGINADASLEAEADAAGERAAQGLPAAVAGMTSPEAGVQRAADPGKTGGKVTLEDFAVGVTPEQVAAAGDKVAATNRMTLEQVKAMVGKATELAPRSTEEMLAAIMSKVLPRWVARVGAKAGFDAGSFGYAGSNQIFATEPADVLGLGAAHALVKVGWTPDQLGGQVGNEIAVCVFDTQAPVNDERGAAHTPGVSEMNWDTLELVAKDPAKNAWFHSQLGKYKTATASVTVDDLPEMFALAKQLPVGAEPDTDEPLVKEKYKLFRMALGSGVAASELFSGMGATVSETGQLGAREVMITNEGSRFKLTPDNHVVHSLGVLQQADVDALIGKPPTAS